MRVSGMYQCTAWSARTGSAYPWSRDYGSRGHPRLSNSCLLTMQLHVFYFTEPGLTNTIESNVEWE